MVKLLPSSPVTEIGEGVFVIDLVRIKGGTPAVLRRIPAGVPGVYAWYRGFSVPAPDTAIPQDFARALIQAATSPHCAEREARLPPSMRVLLQPHQVISEKKQRAIAAYSKSVAFRRMIVQLLDMALFFQQPLYVGKAANLAQRIEQHLSPRSTLRTRLNDARISIDTAKLLFVTLEPGIVESIPEVSLADVDSDELAEDDAVSVGAELPLELVMEELLSRLFLPSFTLRYG